VWGGARVIFFACLLVDSKYLANA